MNIKDKPALMLIDIQEGMNELEYYGGNRNNPQAEEKAAALLSFWRQKKLPIIFIKHNGTAPSPLAKGRSGNAFKEIVAPSKDEIVFEKESNSAFIGTTLDQYLKEQEISHLIIVGLTTSHCISSTARMAGNLGYATYVVSDATATFDMIGTDGRVYGASLVHEISLANLHKEFATIINTDKLLDQLNNLNTKE